MNLDAETFRTWLQVLSVVLIPIGAVIYTWIATRDKDNSQHIKAVESALTTKIADHAILISQLESKISHVPSNVDFSKLLSDLRAMQATQDAAHREVHGMRQAIHRIEDFLLKK